MNLKFLKQYLILYWPNFLTGSRTSTYNDYLKNLKVVKPTGKECRYGVLDFEFQCKSSAVKIKWII
jgi:hypothetical protein